MAKGDALCQIKFKLGKERLFLERVISTGEKEAMEIGRTLAVRSASISKVRQKRLFFYREE